MALPTSALELAQAGVALPGDEMDVVHNRQQLQARLDLFEEAIVLTKYRKGRPVSCYEVAPDALATAFSGVPFSTGLLPERCLFYARRDGRPALGVYLPSQQRTLVAVIEGERRTFRIPTPGLVFAGHGTEYRVHAVKQEPHGREGLFRAPFPNVYEAGQICPGDVDFPVCSGDTIHDAAGLFFASEFNTDLAGGKSQAHDSILDLWAELDGEAEYPLEDLVRDGRRTLEDLMKV